MTLCKVAQHIAKGGNVSNFVANLQKKTIILASFPFFVSVVFLSSV